MLVTKKATFLDSLFKLEEVRIGWVGSVLVSADATHLLPLIQGQRVTIDFPIITPAFATYF